MDGIYKKLAKRIDKLTNGYPETESGVELKILGKIFSPEDAEVALKLRPLPETADKIARRFGKTAEEMTAILDAMANKGQIGSFTNAGVQKYMLSPFVIGIWEYQVDHLDKELADLFDEYIPKLVKTIGGYKPALTRVVPLKVSIDAHLQVLHYEDMRGIIEESKSFQLMDCICRKKTSLQGRNCGHTLNNCMVFFKEEGALDYYHFAGKVIDREEALKVLDSAEQEGLVHCTYNTRDNLVWVCNCCSCCCDLLKGLNEHQAPYLLTGSNFVAQIEQDTCSECGVCADERCPTKAILYEDGGYMVISERCIGCGVCTVTCPTESISLTRRPAVEQDTPPANLMTWHLKRGMNRLAAGAKNKLLD